MKTLKFTICVVVMLFFASSSRLNAQTYQFEWRSVFTPEDNVYAWCLNHQIVGENTFHIIFHINPKTGILDFVHANVLHCGLIDYETGEKLIYIDTGMDKTGIWYDWWTSVGVPIPADVGLPTEGRNIWATFQYKTKRGVKYTFHEYYRIHIDESGEVIFDDYKARYDCNE